ncbi:DnaJ domain-containing protein [Sinorhizobium sp. RAC02]|uniref:DnaJ domain-containing protein n=1 Tax=Sinorhizobium sp. RAC02 TaxID=1842534 RepID=UPI000856EC97|nr:DnaJ domain-containing protein [Sinorhizobium sp. RAC02]AOF92579.1 dnaJ domain protein [Sinorhizobium sp. RAC02]
MTLYEVLRVTPDSTSTDIEVAYAKRRGTSHTGFLGKLVLALKLYADVDYAYSILSNQMTRQHYDRSPDDFLEFYPVAIVI